MADQTVTVPMDDKELFAAAMADEAPQQEQKPAETPAEQPRDEQGRFVPKEELKTEAEPAVTHTDVAEGQVTGTTEKKEEPQADQEGNIPPWRLREMREERDAAEQRAAEARRELQMVARRLQELEKPKAEPLDPYANPEAFRDQGVRQAIDPIKQELDQVREYFSRRDAVREYGEDAVKEAYHAMDTALGSGDREAFITFEQAKNSLDPYSVIMRWHVRNWITNEIGGNPEAYFERKFEEKLKDKDFTAKLVERLRGNAPTVSPDGSPVVKLPPSLNRAVGTGGSPTQPEDNDDSDAGIFRYAMDSKPRASRRG